MSWYFQHQLARDIIAQHEREADNIRLARLYDQADREDLTSESQHSQIRRAIGGTVLAFGEAVTRVGRALDGAESRPSA